MEVTGAHEASVEGLVVRRLLPHRLPKSEGRAAGRRRTVGAWVFLDHFGPHPVTPDRPVAVGPHPHTGLATVTWLLEGEQRHRDSLGSDAVIKPGQLNLMHAGRGVAHAEESLGFDGTIHGLQLWVAQPDATRHGPAAFEHHGSLPVVVLGAGSATVLVGSFGGVTSPARADTPLLAVDLALEPGRTVLELEPGFEHGFVVPVGSVVVGRVGDVGPGSFAYLEPGESTLVLDVAGPSRVVLLGGEPLGFHPLMWWNFVARTGAELREAYEGWVAASGRFGDVDSALPRIEAPAPPEWARLR